MKHFSLIARTALVVLVILAFTACNAVFMEDSLESSAPSKAVSATQGGESFVIEAEDYSYMSGIQTEGCSEGGLNIGWTDAGDWVAYPVRGWQGGAYLVEARVASFDGDGGEISLDLDAGSIQLGNITVNNTGGWQNWTTVSLTVQIPDGDHSFGYSVVNGGININWIKFTYLDSPTPTPASITIEAEDYSYMSGIQTEGCSEGGLNVGWIDAGDWIAYASRNFTEGDYLVEYRVASLSGGGRLSSDLDAGTVQLGSLDVPSTGGWQNWTTISHTVNISGGEHTFGIYAVSGDWNINWIKFTYLGGSSTPSPQPTTTPPPSTGDWNLVWSDEFDGNSLNNAFWTAETGGNGWGNNELQYYTNRGENIQVSGGTLQIIARRESYNGIQYTSARLKTQDKVYKTYGKVEARIRLSQTGSGLWPAFWMLGNNISSVSWPACGEIDIMEHVNNDPLIHGTIHWDASGHAYYGDSIQADVTQWHVYTIEWDESSIKWFVDGVQYNEANIAGSVNSTEEFHRPFFILLNVAVGGNWPGFTIDDSIFPVTMYVDWVRWYQK